MNSPPTLPDSPGLKVGRLLLPINLAKCPLAVFALADRLTGPFGAEVVLLHVIEGRASEGKILLAQSCLQQLGRDHLRPGIGWVGRVRTGDPTREIINEAEASRADLILLPTLSVPLWKRLLGQGFGTTTRSLVSRSARGVFVIEAGKPSNCWRRWTEDEFSGPRAA